MIPRLIHGLFWLTALVVGCASCGAVDLFMECGDKIKGETQDREFKPRGAIDVLAWGWGMSQSSTTYQGGGSGAGRPSFQDLSFVKWLDKATPPLMKTLALGTRIPSCKLTCRKAGYVGQKYIQITMTDCIVTSISTGGTGAEDRFTEYVTLNFAAVKTEYFQANSLGIDVSAGLFNWDIAANSWIDAGAGGGGEVPENIRASVVYVSGQSTAKLSWPSVVGKTYRISSAASIDAAFAPWGEIGSAPGATATSIDVPLSGLQRLFRVDVVP